MPYQLDVSSLTIFPLFKREWIIARIDSDFLLLLALFIQGLSVDLENVFNGDIR